MIEVKKPIRVHVTILVAVTIMDLLLARLGVIALPVGPASSGLYFSVAFMIPFSLWFGGWGVIAAYVGCYVGAGMLSDMPHNVNLYWSLADVWQVLIPFLAFRRFTADVGLRTRRDLLIFLLFGWILNNLAGASWGATTLAVGGLTAWSEVPNILVGWLIGNLIVTIAITPLLLRYLTPQIKKAELYISNYWA